MKSNKSIKIFILMLLACFANAQTTITVIKLHEQTDLPYHVKESNTTGNMSKVDELISLAKSKLGSSYEPTKAGPDHFDCSGFVYYLFTTIGISIPRTSIGQSESGKKLTREELEKGDMLFFDTYQRNHINHSGVYLGDGKFIHSTSGKAYGVIISDLDKGFYLDKFRWGIRIIENGTKSAIVENEGN
ncbi:MAG: C40 family peptidase [Sulfurovaceae bacterium]